MCVPGALRGQKLELGTMAGVENQASTRTANAPNHWAISPAPRAGIVVKAHSVCRRLTYGKNKTVGAGYVSSGIELAG